MSEHNHDINSLIQQLATELREKFGDDSIRITRNHCKFVVFKNENWNLVLRTSMNLNLNRRLEDFEISDCPKLCRELIKFTDSLWSEHKDGEQFNQQHYDILKDFEKMSSEKILSEDPMGINISKVGLSTQKGVIK